MDQPLLTSLDLRAAAWIDPLIPAQAGIQNQRILIGNYFPALRFHGDERRIWHP
jgi:hypothetical protein